MLAHKASEEGIAVAEYLAGQKPHVNYHALPSVIYTAPELASVGLTEEQVKDSGRKYRVGKFPFTASGRAKSLDETEGVVKILADATTDALRDALDLSGTLSEAAERATRVVERLKITDTAAGIYDVKFVDKSGRTCIVPNVQVKVGAIFTIEEKELKGCAK